MHQDTGCEPDRGPAHCAMDDPHGREKKDPISTRGVAIGWYRCQGYADHARGCARRLPLDTHSLCPLAIRDGGFFRRAELRQIIDGSAQYKDRSGIMRRALRFLVYFGLLLSTGCASIADFLSTPFAAPPASPTSTTVISSPISSPVGPSATSTPQTE